MQDKVTHTGDAREISKYFKRFQRLAEPVGQGLDGEPLYEDHMVLKGDMLIVERLPKVELKTKGGIIMPHDVKTYKDTMSDRVTDFGIVLMTGPGHVFDDGTRAECECKPGDVILLPGNVAWYSAFGTMVGYEAFSIGLVRDAQIMLQFTDYQKAFEILNEVLNEKD